MACGCGKLSDASLIMDGVDNTDDDVDVDVRASLNVVVAITWDASAAGNLDVLGSIDGTNFAVMASPTAAASTTTLVHIDSMSLLEIRVSPDDLSAGTVDVSVAQVVR